MNEWVWLGLRKAFLAGAGGRIWPMGSRLQTPSLDPECQAETLDLVLEVMGSHWGYLGQRSEMAEVTC